MRTLLLALLLGCQCGDPTADADAPTQGTTVVSPPRSPILLIGLDGMEWSIAAPLLKEGKLPAVAALMERGIYGRLKSQSPTLSPIIWTSIATGRTADAHGIYGFETRTRKPRLVASHDRKVKAFWNILSERERNVATVGWWVTWPVEEVQGVTVAQVNTVAPGKDMQGMAKGALWDDVPDQVFPEERAQEFLDIVPTIQDNIDARAARIFGAPYPTDLGEVPDRLWQNSWWAIRADAIYHQATLNLLDDDPGYDLTAVYFGSPDVFGHRYMRYLQPDKYENPPTAEEQEALGNILPNIYIEADRMIGELVEAAGTDTTIMLVSDHGMVAEGLHKKYEPQQSNRTLNSGGHTHAPASFFVAAGPSVRSRRGQADIANLRPKRLKVFGGVIDVLPTLLAMQGLPVGADMEGEVMDIINEDWLAAHPVETIPTYTPQGWSVTSNQGSEDPREDARQDQLRALGYIE
jgi:predicted AlkP superfamily pyrophosphatase or phosphodiesterase